MENKKEMLEYVDKLEKRIKELKDESKILRIENKKLREKSNS